MPSPAAYEHSIRTRRVRVCGSDGQSRPTRFALVAHRVSETNEALVAAAARRRMTFRRETA
ncbi:MAG TPA: hypothetical protein VMU73_06510 [Gaiellaceae bacterium]|nr:hypothetical protein [Gaiellaceae bacterium]